MESGCHLRGDIHFPISKRTARTLRFWRFLLSPSPSAQSVFVSLGNVRSMGKERFPAISMPIKTTPTLEKTPVKKTAARSNACQVVVYRRSPYLSPKRAAWANWRLLLSPPPIHPARVRVRSMGRELLPVISIPMGITPKLEKCPERHIQIERVCRASFSGLGDLHRVLRERTSFYLDMESTISAPIWKAKVLAVLEI